MFILKMFIVKEIKKFKNKLHNGKWRGDRHKTYTLLYTTPKRGKVKQMRKTLLKEIYDLQDDLEWICHSHYMLYHSGSHRDPGIHFPREINDLDVNHSMYWSFRSDTSDIWLDLVVSPTHMNTTDVRAGFCLVDGELVNLDDGNDGRICFNRLLECIEESCDQLEILETHVKKFTDIIKIQSLMRGNMSRLTSKSEGRITKKQFESDRKSLKHKMQANGFTPEEIKEFHNETYRASMKKSKKKRHSSKKKKKSKNRKRK